MKPANQYRQIRGAPATIIFGVLIFYIMQMAPSSLLPQIKQGLGPESEVLLNLVVNIVFFFIVIGCLAGSHIEKRWGTKNMYTLALFLGGLGLILQYILFAFDWPQCVWTWFRAPRSLYRFCHYEMVSRGKSGNHGCYQRFIPLCGNSYCFLYYGASLHSFSRPLGTQSLYLVSPSLFHHDNLVLFYPRKRPSQFWKLRCPR